MVGRLVVALVACVSSLALADELEDPTLDLGSGKDDVPRVPSFEIAVPSPDAKGVEQLRTIGAQQFLDKEVTVRGYVTWTYDCIVDKLRPGKTRSDVQKELDADQTKCDPKSLYLGDAKTTTPVRGLWVVDVAPKAPALAVGDYVEIKGTFTRGGRLVYASARKVSPGKITLVAAIPPTTVPPLVVDKPMPVKPVDAAKRKTVLAAMELGRKEHRSGRWPQSMAAYRKALAIWDTNQVAWYELAGSAVEPGDWVTAREAFGKTFALAPKSPVYAMEYGHALYLAEYILARIAEGKRLGINEEYVMLKGSEAALDGKQAQQLLEYSISLAPDQWRAHLYLGDIHRDRGHLKAAASEYSLAVARRPNDHAPYLALAALYRLHDYFDEALAVALAGTSTVKVEYHRGAMQFELGLIYEAKADDTRAIDAFTRAIPDGEAVARLHRGQAYFRQKQWPKAKLDLEAFLKSPPLASEIDQRIANKLLIELATKK